MTDTTKQIEQAAEEARAVFKDSCNHTHQAIDYMKVVLLEAARATPVSPAQSEGPYNAKIGEDGEYELTRADGIYAGEVVGEIRFYKDADFIVRACRAAATPAKPQSDLHSAPSVYELHAALDAAYPIPDSPHTSVIERAKDCRAAMVKGWDARHAAAELVMREQHNLVAAAQSGPNQCDLTDYNTRVVYSNGTAPVPAPATVDTDAIIELVAKEFEGYPKGTRIDADFAAGKVRTFGRKLKGKAAPSNAKPEAVAPVVQDEWKFRVLDTNGNSLTVCLTHADAKSWIDFNSSFSIVPYTPAPVAVAPVAGEGLTDERLMQMWQEAMELPAPWGTEKAVLHFARAILATQAERQPQPAAQAAVPDWTECERIADLLAVDMALENFSHDSTADNAICIVRAVLEAIAAPAAVPQQPSAAHAYAAKCVSDELRRALEPQGVNCDTPIGYRRDRTDPAEVANRMIAEVAPQGEFALCRKCNGSGLSGSAFPAPPECPACKGEGVIPQGVEAQKGGA